MKDQSQPSDQTRRSLRSDTRGCHEPKLISELFEDPTFIGQMCKANSPYFPVQRYVANADEATAIGDPKSAATGKMFVAPNFRGDWAYGEPFVEGAERFLNNQKLIDAAKDVFGAEVVVPHIVYSNFTWQLPFNQGGGHIDIPAFRGFDRTTNPIWILTVMGHSGLFTEYQIQIATAVCWFYGGTDGGLDYWPDGLAGQRRSHEGSINNTAMVGDNDNMFHRVRPVGEPTDGIITGMSLGSELCSLADDQWSIVEAGEELARFGSEQLRLSVSWKANVFQSQEDRVRAENAEDPLTIDDVVEIFGDDMAAQGVEFAKPDDALRDRDWVQVLTETYVSEPAA